MRRTLSAVKPTCFEDIIALVSLYRPGPMDNIPSFGARKNGRETIEYPYPPLEGVLQETYDLFVYREQVMQAAQLLASYSDRKSVVSGNSLAVRLYLCGSRSIK